MDVRRCMPEQVGVRMGLESFFQVLPSDGDLFLCRAKGGACMCVHQRFVGEGWGSLDLVTVEDGNRVLLSET